MNALPWVPIREFSAIRFHKDELSAIVDARRIGRSRGSHKLNECENVMAVRQKAAGLEGHILRIDATSTMRINGCSAGSGRAWSDGRQRK